MSHSQYQYMQRANETEMQHSEHAPRIPSFYFASESDDRIDDNSPRQTAYAATAGGPDAGRLEKSPHVVDSIGLEAAVPRTLQTHYSTIAWHGQKKLGHNYRPLKQFWKLAQRLIARWLLNFLLCSLLVVMFKFYERDGILTQFEKRIFNGLFLGLSLFISMNMVVRGWPVRMVYISGDADDK